MFFSGFCFEIPTAVVWLIGIFIAVNRWKLHPGVSAAVCASLGCMLTAVVGQAIGLSFLFASASPTTIQRTMLILGIVGFFRSMLRAAGWASMLMAIFGWRDDAAESARRSPLQFSIRNLLALTLVVAVLCALMRGLVDLLGESAIYLLGLLDEMPTVICWFYGGWLARNRRKRHPQVARRAAIAIGLSLGALLTLAVTILSMFTAGFEYWGPGVYFLTAVLASPISWALLLTAAFGWRTLDDPFQPRAPDKPFGEPLGTATS